MRFIVALLAIGAALVVAWFALVVVLILESFR